MKTKYNHKNSWSWTKEVYDKSYQGLKMCKTSKEFAKIYPAYFNGVKVK